MKKLMKKFWFKSHILWITIPIPGCRHEDLVCCFKTAVWITPAMLGDYINVIHGIEIKVVHANKTLHLEQKGIPVPPWNLLPT